MAKVVLSKPITVKGQKVTEVNLDFDSITGNDLAEAETEVRMMGDKTPSVLLSMKYQAVIAAKLIGVPVDDVLAMSGKDFRNIIFPVADFLLN